MCLRDDRRTEETKLADLNDLITQTKEEIEVKKTHVEMMEASVFGVYDNLKYESCMDGFEYVSNGIEKIDAMGICVLEIPVFPSLSETHLWIMDVFHIFLYYKEMLIGWYRSAVAEVGACVAPYVELYDYASWLVLARVSASCIFQKLCL
nr:hypothetical protein [Tanacetum cinerariifolium]